MARDPAMGNLDYAREEQDFYPTPAWVTEAIVPEVMSRVSSATRRNSWGKVLWEPACGDGRMHAVLSHNLVPDYADQIGATDINPRGYGQQEDFLSVESILGHADYHEVRGIITNPPYGKLAQRFVEHALHLMKPVQGFVCMLLRNEWDSAKERIHLTGRHHAFAKKLVLTSRPRWIEGTTGSPRHNYAWFVWDWEDQDPPRITYHVRPGKGD